MTGEVGDGGFPSLSDLSLVGEIPAVAHLTKNATDASGVLWEMQPSTNIHGSTV